MTAYGEQILIARDQNIRLACHRQREQEIVIGIATNARRRPWIDEFGHLHVQVAYAFDIFGLKYPADARPFQGAPKFLKQLF